jgi:glycosyltransferase involved in cell wall biosynthesis
MKTGSQIFENAEAVDGPAERRAVVVTHPGKQHVYRTVEAAEKHRLLQFFATGGYVTDQSALGRMRGTLSRLLRRNSIVRGLQRRSDPGIDESRVIAFPQYEIAARLIAMLDRRGVIARHAERACDRRIARWLSTVSPTPQIVHGFEGGTLATFEAAAAIGAARLLDVPSAHEHYVQVLREEGESVDIAETARVVAERELADVLLAPSNYVRRCLIANGVSNGRIVELPYGTDVARFWPRGRRGDGVFRALFVGQLSVRKGVRYLLDAWESMRLPNAELVLAGAVTASFEPILHRYQGLFVRAGFLDQNELAELYRSADVFLFPSLADAWPLAVADAMASGLPVVTTSSTGVPVRDGIDGFIVAPRDVEALEQKTELLFREPELRMELGRNARALVESRYTWEHYEQRLATLYRKLLGGSSADAPAFSAMGGQ